MMRTLFFNSLKKAALLAFFSLMSVGAYAQVTHTDTVCASTQDKVYGIMGSNPTSTYTWSLSDPAAGVIDNSFAPNDSIIEIDWGTVPGSYSLYVVESTNEGCAGDTITLDVVINPLPTAVVVSDSVCPDFSATLTFDFTGTAPWIIEYTDGTTNFTDTAAATPFTASLPPYATSQTVTVTAVTDGNTCEAETTALPTTPVHVYPTPGTGAIYHY